MKRWWLVLAVAVAGGCLSGPGDVVGPFTGEVRRFVVDDIRLPKTNPEAAELGGDLNGDGVADNILGSAIVFLGSQGNVSPHGADMIRSGAIASSVEIQADDLRRDDSVAVRYLGAEGAGGQVVGGRFIDGAFHPNRTAETDHPGEAVVRLPVFLDADPSEIRLHALEIELDPDGAGGYVATLHGAIAAVDVFPAMHPGLTQMIAANPGDHLVFARLLDLDRNGEITPDETRLNTLLRSVLAPDLRLRGFEGQFLSVGFQVHLSPCAEGHCAAGTPADRCHDRVRDGDESDVDCGGSCPLACAPLSACGQPADCQSGACASGVCTATSCGDGLRNGFETDVDCGGPCAPCGVGAACIDEVDCEAALVCQRGSSPSFPSPGVCRVP